MRRKRPDLLRREPAADGQHLAQAVASPLARLPSQELGFRIGSRLAGERRIARPDALAFGTVAGRTGRQAARRIAMLVELSALVGGLAGNGRGRRQGGIVGGDLRPILAVEPEGNGPHGGVLAPAVGVVVELAVEIAGIQPGEPRRLAAISLAPQAMAGETGIRRAAIAAAEGDHLAIGLEQALMRRLLVAGDEQDEDWQKAKAHAFGTDTLRRRFRKRHRSPEVPMLRLWGLIGSMVMLLSGCDSAEVAPNSASTAAITRGQAAAERLGCGACHTMPGVPWPQGKVGPALHDFGERAMIAGYLPNRPDMLARFVRDAPALVPGTAMPAVPMDDAEARDIAAWLQSLRGR